MPSSPFPSTVREPGPANNRVGDGLGDGDRLQLILANDFVRKRAHQLIDAAPVKTRVVFHGPKRTVAQNDKLWPLLNDVAQQTKYHGLRLSPEDYKVLFMDALNRAIRMVPNIDGTGFVALGRSSSKLSVAEMRDLIELIYAYGAREGVRWTEPTLGEPA